MNNLRSVLLAASCLVAVVAGCTVPDADLDASPAIRSLDATASTDLLTQRQSTINGQIELGYTSDQLVQIRVLGDGAVLHSQSLHATSRELVFQTTVDVLEPGTNALTVEAEFHGQRASRQLSVDVPAALQSFTLLPQASAVNVFAVSMTGTIGFGWYSDSPALVDVYVEGSRVLTVEVFPETLDVPVSLDVPLEHEGSNEVVAVVRYGGEEATSGTSVEVTMDAPTLTFPAWVQTYQALQGMDVSGNVSVSIDNAYDLAAVEFSVDNGPWTPAIDAGGGNWTVAFENPDLGTNDVAVRVTEVADGHEKTVEFHDVLTVAPVFVCATPSQVMLPSTTLTQDNVVELRTMSGYFGRPDGGHSVSFVVRATASGDAHTIVGKTIERGPALMSVEFRVAPVDCGFGGCDVDYSLEAVVDGAQLCFNGVFGQITNL